LYTDNEEEEVVRERDIETSSVFNIDVCIWWVYWHCENFSVSVVCKKPEYKLLIILPNTTI